MSNSDLSHGAIQPYSFEPQRRALTSSNQNQDAENGAENGTHAEHRPVHDVSDSESDSEWDGLDVETEGWRLQNTLWCTCGHCAPLPTIRENLCCKEMEQIKDKIDGLTCIIANPDFPTVCLNPVVLRTALIARNDIRRDDLRDPIQNR